MEPLGSKIEICLGTFHAEARRQHNDFRILDVKWQLFVSESFVLSEFGFPSTYYDN